MTKQNLEILHVIDTKQYNRFKSREKTRLGIPECILEECSLNFGIEMSSNKECAPMTQYKNAEGFEFTWGHILERRTDRYIVWDFCFTHLLTQYLATGKRLSDLQRVVYYHLERTVECTTRDIIPVLSMQEGWKIIPCSAVGAFSLVIHFSQEANACEWIINELFHDVLPVLMTALQKDAVKT